MGTDIVVGLMFFGVSGRLADMFDDFEGSALILGQDKFVVMVIIIDALAGEVKLHVEYLSDLNWSSFIYIVFHSLMLDYALMRLFFLHLVINVRLLQLPFH
jgi:hypothetical protein